jgi:phosphoribosylaminoimidazole (AIR) synthetase
VGEELLQPTDIYVRPVMDLLNHRRVPVRAMANITSDGFLNLARIKAAVGFRLDRLPEPQPIFRLIQAAGDVTTAEMYRVFNMGIGFCLIVPDDPGVLRAVEAAFAAHPAAGGGRLEALRIGTVVADERRRVFLPAQELVGEGDVFSG